MPRSIYNFAIRYLGNCLPNRSNSCKWGITSTSICNFCPNLQTLGHIVGGCKAALAEGRYNWRHDSILLSLSRALATIPSVSIYSDIKEGNEFLSPEVITGEKLRPDLIAVKGNRTFICELSVGLETNMIKNATRKKEKYQQLVKGLTNAEEKCYLNLSMGGIGIVSKDSSNVVTWLQEIGLSDAEARSITRKLMNICMRCTYYIFCQRDKPWEAPNLLNW
jgi:hypothetical protein